MKIIYEDGDADYDYYQQIVVEEIAHSVRERLEAAGLGGALLKELVAGIAFDVGVIVDGSRQMQTDNDDVLVPMLGFLEARTRDRLVLSSNGGGSSLHEFVAGVVSEMFLGNGG